MTMACRSSNDSFSADTLPTQSLVRNGQGATLLIHEATMGDGEEAMARVKSHSTVGQAIEIGRKYVSRWF
jgi:ribonuclease Z